MTLEMMCHPGRCNYVPTPGLFDIERLATLPKEDFTVCSGGAVIKGTILLQPKHQGRVVILSHGLTAHREQVVSYYEMFYDIGYDVVMFDQRCHGESKAPFCSMGLYESDDVAEIASFCRKRFGEGIVLGLYGESMGSATIMLAAPKIEGLSFVVEDCGFSDMMHMMDLQGKDSRAMRNEALELYGFDMAQISPIKAVAKCPDVPMMFIHGHEDHFVDWHMCVDLYEAKQGKKALKLYEGSGHGRSYIDHKAQYIDDVRGFLHEADPRMA